MLKSVVQLVIGELFGKSEKSAFFALSTSDDKSGMAMLTTELENSS